MAQVKSRMILQQTRMKKGRDTAFQKPQVHKVKWVTSQISAKQNLWRVQSDPLITICHVLGKSVDHPSGHCSSCKVSCTSAKSEPAPTRQEFSKQDLSKCRTN